MGDEKHIVLIYLDDPRRQTRVQLLMNAGYEVKVRKDWISSQELYHEGSFDLVILSLHRRDLKQAVAYGEQLHRGKPKLPILLLTDVGVLVPRGTLNPAVEAGDPQELIREVTAMLAGSTHIRQIDSKSVAAD